MSTNPTSFGDTSQTGHDTDGASADYRGSTGHAIEHSTADTTTTSSFGDNTDGLGRDRSDALTADEDHKLISADKVIGTAVYNGQGDRLGTIDAVMLNKRSGRVAYAVMSFGGFLGIGERYHPLPWDTLSYDEDKGGYNLDRTNDQLKGGPSYSRDELQHLDYGQEGSRIRGYYGVNVGRGTEAGAGGAPMDRAYGGGSTVGAAPGSGSVSGDTSRTY